MRRLGATYLRRNWSPQQIAGWLKSNHPEDEALRVSHETIYRSLFVQARGVLKKALIEHLRTHRPIRRSRHATSKADTRRTWCRSASGRPRSMIVLCQDTGKATC